MYVVMTVFCCSVQCILPSYTISISSTPNSVSGFRDSFVALHLVPLFMSLRVTSVGRCLRRCFKKYTVSCCRVHMHLFEILSLQLENQDFLRQRWFTPCSSKSGFPVIESLNFRRLQKQPWLYTRIEKQLRL